MAFYKLSTVQLRAVQNCLGRGQKKNWDIILTNLKFTICENLFVIFNKYILNIYSDFENIDQSQQSRIFLKILYFKKILQRIIAYLEISRKFSRYILRIYLFYTLSNIIYYTLHQILYNVSVSKVYCFSKIFSTPYLNNFELL